LSALSCIPRASITVKTASRPHSPPNAPPILEIDDDGLPIAEPLESWRQPRWSSAGDTPAPQVDEGWGALDE
jgi:hypothetical protein